MTVAITNYLLERVGSKVNLCKLQGNQWVVIARNITPARAERVGFNLESPSVMAMFGMR